MLTIFFNFLWLSSFFLNCCLGNDLDWNTYGFYNTRLSINPKEYIISASSASNLQQKWVVKFPSPMIAQPVVAVDLDMTLTPTHHNLRGLKTTDGWNPPLGPHRSGSVAGENNRNCTDTKSIRTLAYVADTGGNFYAIDADEGCIYWSVHLGAYEDVNCGDLPIFGNTGSAVFDRKVNTIYILSALGTFYALSMQTGAVLWSVPGAFDNSLLFSYGSLLLYNNNIYFTLGSRCDIGAYHGGISYVSIATRAVSSNTFYPSKEYVGGGVWGLAGVTMNDAASNVPIIYTPTGNSIGGVSENMRFCEEIVGLNPNYMSLIGSTTVPSNSLGEPDDNDFGSSAVFFNGPSEPRVNQCPRSLIAAGRKDGFYFVVDAKTFAIIQTIKTQTEWQMIDYVFQGAWDADSSTLVIPVYGNATSPSEGVSAYTLGSDCQLKLKWHTYLYHVHSPTIAGPPGNRVVAVGGIFQVHVLDFQTGKILFQPKVSGFVMNAPTIADGIIYYSVFESGDLYAYNISGVVPTMAPSQSPAVNPSRKPTPKPTSPTSRPSLQPSVKPTITPSVSPSTIQPLFAPTLSPSSAPSSTQTPSTPSISPTQSPSIDPTYPPSPAPSLIPTSVPSSFLPTLLPSTPSCSPTQSPSIAPTFPPSIFPSFVPSAVPSIAPSIVPSVAPSAVPSVAPSVVPSLIPSTKPSRSPTSIPSSTPSSCPSTSPSTPPSLIPTVHPTPLPSLQPSSNPSLNPSTKPTTNPSALPPVKPSSAPVQRSISTTAPQLPILNNAQNADTSGSSSSTNSSMTAIIASVVVVFLVACLAALVYMFVIRPRMQNQKAAHQMEIWHKEGQEELPHVDE